MALLKCADCGRDVSDQAPACPHCGRPVAAEAKTTGTASKCPHCGHEVWPGWKVCPGCSKALAAPEAGSRAAGCFLAIVAAMGACAYFFSSPSPPTSGTAPGAPPAAASPVLELVDWSWRESHSHAIAEGRVRNVSGAALRNVQVVVTFTTAQGEHITSADALIEYNPVLPGQVSPFKAFATWNPAMKKAGVDFKTLMGGALPWRDAGPKTK